MITNEEIEKLNTFQKERKFHPLTCDRHSVNCEANMAPRDYEKDGVLIATKDGWVCPCGEYKQDINPKDCRI